MNKLDARFDGAAEFEFSDKVVVEVEGEPELGVVIGASIPPPAGAEEVLPRVYRVLTRRTIDGWFGSNQLRRA